MHMTAPMVSSELATLGETIAGADERRLAASIRSSWTGRRAQALPQSFRHLRVSGLNFCVLDYFI